MHIVEQNYLGAARQQSRLFEKVVIQEKLSPSPTAHLLPVIDFLKSQGNPVSPPLSYNDQEENGFNVARDGLKTFRFDKPLDLQALKEHFDFPPTIGFTKEGNLWDKHNRVGISQATPVEK